MVLAGVGSTLSGDSTALVRYGSSLFGVLFVASMAEGQWVFRRREGTGRKRLEVVPMALLSGIVVAGILLAVGRVSYYFLILAEGVLTICLTVVLHGGVHFLLFPPEREQGESGHDRISGRIVISLILLLIGALLGVPEVKGFSFVYTGSALAVLYLGYLYGVGAATIAGAMAGVAMGILRGEPEMVGYLTLFGMVSAVLGELGRVSTVLTWLMLQASAGFLWNDFFIQTQGLVGVLPAFMIFLILPGRKGSAEISEEEDLYRQVGMHSRERMRELAISFRRLADLMGNPGELQYGLSGADFNRIFNQVSHGCCGVCGKRDQCLRGEFYDAYHQTFQILGQIEKQGALDLEQIPREFLERCIRPETFLAEVVRSLEVARSNLIWHNRMIENRTVVAEQFAGVAGMMEEIIQEMNTTVLVRSREEELVREGIRSAGVEVNRVTVRNREDGRMEIFLTVRMPGIGCMTARELAGVLGEVTGKVLHSSFGSKTVVGSDWGSLVFLEDTAFCFYSGVALSPREGESRSGDSHSMREMANGEVVLLLSDGMGSGGDAFRESSRMVELMEQFLEAGLESGAAMKMIQSSLFLKSTIPTRKEEERFVTVDLFRINLCNGLAKYLKVGAADSFLVREKVVNRISSPGLPVGILAPLEPREEEVQLREGDFLVMATDGFHDCFREEDVLEVLRSVVGSRKQNNASELARILLEAALVRCEGIPQDDITVMVTGIWETERVARATDRW